MRHFVKTLVATIALFAVSIALHPAAAQDSPAQTLKALLTGMGYEVTEGEFKNKSAKLTITIHKDWQYDINFEPRDNGDLFVFLDFGLYSGSADDIPVEVFRGLLDENARRFYAHFEFLSDTSKFRLLAPTRWQQLTAVDLRRVIDEIVDTADATEELWNPEMWPGGPPASAQTGGAGESSGSSAGTAEAAPDNSGGVPIPAPPPDLASPAGVGPTLGSSSGPN